MQTKPVSEMLPLSKNHLADLLKLKQKKFRKLEDKTLVEGVNLIEQLLGNGMTPLEIISSDPQQIALFSQDRKFPVYLAKAHEIAKLADTETPQPMIGVYTIPQFKAGDYRLAVYLDGIQDPGNLGAIFRIAAAFNLDAIFLSPDCCEVWSPKVVRASLGSVFWIKSASVDENWLADQKAEKIGLVMQGSTLLKDVKIDKKKAVIVVIGSEGNGIKPAQLAALDQQASIPISKQMESLNAAVATGIALYEISHRFNIDTKSRMNTNAGLKNKGKKEQV